MKHKRFTAALLSLLLLVGCCSGCKAAPETASSSAPTAEGRTGPSEQMTSEPKQTSPAPDETASTPEQTEPSDPAAALPQITWAKAFRSSKVPDGILRADSVAFLKNKGEQGMEVICVPLAEVYANQPARLPRTRFFEQFMPEALVEGLLPVIDYAMAGGYSRICIPTADFNYGTILEAASFLAETYSINGSGAPGALEIQSFSLEDGRTLAFLLVTLGGMEARNIADSYLEGVAAAEAVVDAMPKDLDEMGKILYLYRYLTDNVRYDYNNYYTEQNWCLLYDALVRKSTVCAGFTEALYVLANLAGLDCLTISGYISITGNAGYHIWNIVRVNGSYYQFDSTWDEGKSPAEYQYFGVSDAFMQTHAHEHVTAFAEEYCPRCETDLLPPELSLEGVSDEEYVIIWYYRLRNARAYDPAQMLRYFGYSDAEIAAQTPVDGWVQTDVSLTDVFNLLCGIMSMEQAVSFVPGYFLGEEGEGLQYHVPLEDPAQTRLTGLEKNEDGTWTAQLYEFRGGIFTEQQAVITLQAMSEDWSVVDKVELKP